MKMRACLEYHCLPVIVEDDVILCYDSHGGVGPCVLCVVSRPPNIMIVACCGWLR